VKQPKPAKPEAQPPADGPTPEHDGMDAFGRPLPGPDLPLDRRDANDPAVLEAKRKEQGRRRRADNDVLRKLMHDVDGRDWLYRKLEACHIYQTSFSPGQPDVTAFNLGMENFGKQLMLEAQRASADLYVKMIKEQNDKKDRKGE
jgi:hypothetical protein